MDVHMAELLLARDHIGRDRRGTRLCENKRRLRPLEQHGGELGALLVAGYAQSGVYVADLGEQAIV